MDGQVKQYGLLVVAILAEVRGTSALKAANGFRVLGPSVLVVVGYSLSFYCLSLSLRTIPVGVAYAIWSAVGQILVMSSPGLSIAKRWTLPRGLGSASSSWASPS